MRKIYSTDLSDGEWACLKTHLPASKLPGTMRAHSLREIFDAIFYVLKSGCPWRLLPGGFPRFCCSGVGTQSESGSNRGNISASINISES